MKRKKDSPLDLQEHFTFRYHEMLQAILKDLRSIDELIPREISRYASASMERESDAIIQARKHDLLGYIQTICRDHMLYAKRLTDDGKRDCPWTPQLGKVYAHGRAIPHSREDQIGFKKGQGKRK